MSRTSIFLSTFRQTVKVFSLLFVAITLLCSCGTDKTDELTPAPQPTPTPSPSPEESFSISLSADSINVPSEGGSYTVLVSYTPKSAVVAVRASEKWIDVEFSNGHAIISVNPNVTSEPRKGTISFYNGSDPSPKAIIEVTQQGQRGETRIVYELTENTVGIDSNISKQITSVNTESHVIHWSSKVNAESLPKVGENCIFGIVPDVLPYGLLARVEKIEEVADGYDVKYTQLEMKDCFMDLDIQNLVLDMRDVQYFEVEGDNASYAPTRAFNTTRYAGNLPISISKDIKFFGEKFVVTPQVSGELSAVVDVKFDGLSFKKAAIDYTTDVNLDINAAIILAESSPNFGHKELANYRVGMTIVPAGKIPIVIVLHVAVDFVHKYSAKLSFDSSIGYSINQRVSKTYYDDGSSDTSSEGYGSELKKFSIGPKVEGSYQYGLSVGPIVSVYDLCGFGVSKTFQVKATASTKAELNAPECINRADLTWILQHTSLSLDFVSTIVGDFWSLFGKLNTDDIKNQFKSWANKSLDDAQEFVSNICSYNVIPTVSTDYKVRREKEMVTMELELSDRFFIFNGLRVRYEAIEDNNVTTDLPMPVVAVFDISDNDLFELKNGNSINVEAHANLDSRFQYKATVEMDLLGGLGGDNSSWFRVMYFDKLEFKSLSDEVEAAIHGILNDLLASRDGVWEGCNWNVEGISVLDCENVMIDNADVPEVTILIPEEWRMKSDIKVSDHTSHLGTFGYWSLVVVDNENCQFNSIEVTDSHCKELIVGNQVSRFVLNSPIATDIENSIPSEVMELDLSYTPISDFKADAYSYIKLNRLSLNHCPNLKSIDIVSNTNEERRNMVEINCVDCPNLSSMIFQHFRFKGNELATVELPTIVQLRDCAGGNLELKGDKNSRLSTLSVDYEDDAVLSLNSFAALNDISVKRGIKELEISDCNNLKILDCHDCTALTTFNPGQLPNLKSLNLQNTSIKAEVPQLFEDIKERGTYTLKYDTLYQYNYEGNEVTWIERDYGYYYEGEPEQGYHGPHLDAQISADPASLDFGMQGGKQTVNLILNGALYYGGYADEDCEDWITVETNGDSELIVTVKENTTGIDRNGTIYGFASNKYKPDSPSDMTLVAISVSQRGTTGDEDSDEGPVGEALVEALSQHKFWDEIILPGHDDYDDTMRISFYRTSSSTIVTRIYYYVTESGAQNLKYNTGTITGVKGHKINILISAGDDLSEGTEISIECFLRASTLTVRDSVYGTRQFFGK